MVREKQRMAAKSKESSVHPAAKRTSAPEAKVLAEPERISKSSVFKSKRSQSQPRPESKRLPAAPKILARSVGLIKHDWKLFAVILAVYGLVYAVLVGGLYDGSLSTAKGLLHQQAHANQLTSGVTLLSTLLSSSSNSNASAGVYQTLLFVIMSLVLIWALRQRYAEQHIRARDAFYRGTYPLIQFLLILLVIGLELLPIVIAGALYTLFVVGSIAVGFLETAIVVMLCVLLAVASLYLLCSSIFALYIVTLPDMTPLRALRSARELVRYRRATILRKVLFLPIILLVIGVAILIPASLYLTSIAALMLFISSIVALTVAHSYMYALYRELL